MESPKLTIELVPKTAWYTNVRSNVPKPKWDKIRRKSYAHAGYKCEVCGDVGMNQGYKHPVECHEIWQYDDEKKTQTLIGLISLCPNCHKAKHPGLAQVRGEIHIVIKQLMKVNEYSEKDAMIDLANAFDQWKERSEYQWDLDISYLEEFLIE